MRLLVRKSAQVASPVVGFNTVLVMDYFTRPKLATEFLFCNILVDCFPGIRKVLIAFFVFVQSNHSKTARFSD